MRVVWWDLLLRCVHVIFLLAFVIAAVASVAHRRRLFREQQQENARFLKALDARGVKVKR